jgi:uncharacterized sulfatase
MRLPKPSRPNVLFVLSDQQRWDTVGCYGQRLDVTPHLDRLAAEGVRFEHAFTMQPVCGPARSCLQTGQHATRTGCFTNARRMPPDAPTIAKSLNRAGYETSYVGKWHLASNEKADPEDRLPRDRPVQPEHRGGYTHWMAANGLEHTSSGYEGYFFDEAGRRVDWEGYRVDRTTDFALDYLRDYATRRPADAEGRDRPFFLFLSLIEPHHQNDLNRYIGPIGSKQRFSDYDTPEDLRAFDSPGSPGPDWRQHYPDYLGCCWSIDRNVGRLREALDLYGLAEDTLIVYTSDHGCHFRTRNNEYKRSCHDASLRVPMIAAGPGFTGGRVCDELVSLIDLPPTILEAAGAEPLPIADGRPLQPLAGGRASDWRDAVFAQISEAEVGRAIRTRRWKYAVRAPDKDANRDAGSPRYVESHLYDLEADPAELNNLVADSGHASTRAELQQLMKRCVAEAGEEPPEIAPADAD